MIARKKLYVLLFIVLGNISFSEASILKLHDKMLVDSRRSGMTQLDFCQNISKASGLIKLMAHLRFFHSILLSRRQPNPITPKELFFRISQRTAPAEMSMEMQIDMAIQVTEIAHGFSLDYAFSEFDAMTTSDIENEVRTILIKIRTIMSGYEPFFRRCEELNLSKELQDTIALIDESV